MGGTAVGTPNSGTSFILTGPTSFRLINMGCISKEEGLWCLDWDVTPVWTTAHHAGGPGLLTFGRSLGSRDDFSGMASDDESRTEEIF